MSPEFPDTSRSQGREELLELAVVQVAAVRAVVPEVEQEVLVEAQEVLVEVLVQEALAQRQAVSRPKR